MTILDFTVFGLIAGLTPGPITALILGETLRKGFKQGIKIPLAIIFSNLIFAPLTFLVLKFGLNSEVAIKVLAYTGAGFLIFLGITDLVKSRKSLELKVTKSPFKKAFLMDLFNAHPYITWFTVLGPPIILAVNNESFLKGIVLAGFFILSLVATKILVVILASKLRKFLTETHIKLVNNLLAIALIGFGLKILYANLPHNVLSSFLQ